MQDQMPDIDTSGIEALQTIKKELDVIAERLDKMETMKEKVSEQVYQKVFQDYNAKRDDLLTEAQPLKVEVRQQYRTLKSAMVELESELSDLKLQREELDFRKELGEFEDSFYDDEVKKLDLDSTGKQADMDEALEMKELFLSVFDSEEDLEASEPEPVPEPELEPEPLAEVEESIVEPESNIEADLDEPLAEVEEDPELLEEEADEAFAEDIDLEDDEEHDASLEDSLGPLPEVEDTIDEEHLDDDLEDLDVDDGDPGETAAMPLDIGGPPEPPAMVPPPPPAPPGAEGDDPDGTMIISNPKIIARNNDIEGQVFVLGMSTTSIGRSPENDVHLTEDRISRKHAQIAFGPGGYAIYDLNSENGSFVNGTRIREHFLSDGDIVMIGSYKFLYRDH
jgi:hypothetical protein